MPSTPLPSTKGNKSFQNPFKSCQFVRFAFVPARVVAFFNYSKRSLACCNQGLIPQEIWTTLATHCSGISPCTQMFFDTSISQHLCYSSMTMSSGPTMAATRLCCIEKSFCTKRRRRMTRKFLQIQKTTERIVEYKWFLDFIFACGMIDIPNCCFGNYKQEG